MDGPRFRLSSPEILYRFIRAKSSPEQIGKMKKGPTTFSEQAVQPKSGLHREKPSSFLSLYPLQLTQNIDHNENHVIGSDVMWPTSTYPPCCRGPHPTAAINPFLSLSTPYSFINFWARVRRNKKTNRVPFAFENRKKYPKKVPLYHTRTVKNQRKLTLGNLW
jgi:hypothetical protein